MLGVGNHNEKGNIVSDKGLLLLSREQPNLLVLNIGNEIFTLDRVEVGYEGLSQLTKNLPGLQELSMSGNCLIDAQRHSLLLPSSPFYKTKTWRELIGGKCLSAAVRLAGKLSQGSRVSVSAAVN